MPQKPLDGTDTTTYRAFRIPERVDDELRRRAELERRPVSVLIRELIVHYLEKAPPAA